MLKKTDDLVLEGVPKYRWKLAKLEKKTASNLSRADVEKVPSLLLVVLSTLVTLSTPRTEGLPLRNIGKVCSLLARFPNCLP